MMSRGRRIEREKTTKLSKLEAGPRKGVGGGRGAMPNATATEVKKRRRHATSPAPRVGPSICITRLHPPSSRWFQAVIYCCNTPAGPQAKAWRIFSPTRFQAVANTQPTRPLCGTTHFDPAVSAEGAVEVAVSRVPAARGTDGRTIKPTKVRPDSSQAATQRVWHRLERDRFC